MLIWYPFDVRDSTNPSTDNLVTGVTFTIRGLVKLDASKAELDHSLVAIVEGVFGGYWIGYDAEATGEAEISLVAVGSVTASNDVYFNKYLTLDSGLLATNLNASVATVLTAASNAATQALIAATQALIAAANSVAANTGVAAINAEMDRENTGTVVSDSGNSTTAATLSGISTDPGNLPEMGVVFVNHSTGKEIGRRTIGTAAVNGSNVKITWVTPLAAAPAVGDTASFP